jgi:hypothetical protein
MTEIGDELRSNAIVLRVKAREAEEQWLAKRGLSKGLHRKGNAIARQRRRRTECPTEPKAAAGHRRYRKKQLGKLGAASKVRRIDPKHWQAVMMRNSLKKKRPLAALYQQRNI